MASNLIAILTDFGDSDPYVGIMKGVISRIAPDLNLIDLNNHIPPGDIQQGAFHLWQAAAYFPSDAVFLAVVDPGVGTSRQGLYLQRGDQVFIGPDNGLFSYLGYKSPTTAWELANPDFQLRNPSSTFHGRDIFAPAAAYATMGIRGEQFGEIVGSLNQLPPPVCQVNKDHLRGEVISIDRFGNLITSLGQFQKTEKTLEINSWIEDLIIGFPPNPEIHHDQAAESLPLVSTFSDIPPGSCAGLIGSCGLLEIVANQSSAAALLKASIGDVITLTWNNPG